MQKRFRTFWVLVMVITIFFGLSVGVLADKGKLVLVGVPSDFAAGRYETKSGVFSVDLSEIEGAYVLIEFEDITITGKVVIWDTQEEHLQMLGGITLIQKDMELTTDQIEYFIEEERFTARGNVVATTEDGTVYSDEMLYYQQEEHAIFSNNVVVEFENGVFKGEKLSFYIEKELIEFIGPFIAEFN